MSTLATLRTIEFVVLVGTNVITLDYAIRAFSRLRWRAFAFWIAASAIDIGLNFSWYIRSNSAALSPRENLDYNFIHRGAAMAASILWAAGLVTLVRDLLKRYTIQPQHNVLADE
jgi:hypothetical protein